MSSQFYWHRLKYYPYRREIKFLCQRLVRGWSDDETFSLDYSLAKLILPRLKRFRELTIGVPSGMTPQEWHHILDQMIDAFEFASGDDYWNATPEDYQQHHQGFDLFAKHYYALWW